MKKLRLVLLVIMVATVLTVAISVFAQASVSSWPFFVEVFTYGGRPGLYEIVLPLEVMDKASEDLADLRLYDATGREIPYAVRVRRDIDDKRQISGTVFNQGVVGSTSEVTVDLGEDPGEHNEVEIQTAGANFRRQVVVEGSDSGSDWRTLSARGALLSFQSENSSVESSRVTYPTSRYRYLRVRVFRDELTDDRAPQITSVRVIMAINVKGELTTWGVPVPSYQLLRNQGAHASQWTIDLGGRVPCDRLALNIEDASFSRRFQLEAVDDPENVRLIATGELTRHVGDAAKPLVITFDDEVHSRKLRLLVTDYSNQTLSISSIEASAPARELVFELKQPSVQLLKLFFGNPKITAPHYDFEKELPSPLTTGRTRVTVGNAVVNPDYKPEPLPLTERVPWLIYLVLAASSIALALILISLARTTLQTQSQPAEE